MAQPARLECPECGSTYRLKRIVPDKAYKCQKCGADLCPAADELPPLPAASPTGMLEKQQSNPITVASGDEWLYLDNRLRELSESLDSGIKSLDSGWDNRFKHLDGKFSLLLERFDPAILSALAEKLEEIARRIPENGETPGEKGEARPNAGAEKDLTLEIDVNALAERLAAKLRGHSPSLVPESGSIIDALTRMADELVKEQSANTSRLDLLANEIRNAVSNIADFEEWRSGLPEKVADEIGRTVETRVVGPISGALARQAPSILSDLQDNRLVDIVSRSVREAQRPLLREILSGGRVGVPVWLFASVLLPLLLLLGYLFLPGEFASNDADDALRRADESLARLEANGIPLAQEADARLRSVEETVLDLHDRALAHARNSAALEEQVKNLNLRLAEKEMLVDEYRDTLQRQVKLLNVYRTRLTQLGATPEPLGE
ncbi:MAG: hypothetical protein LBU23_03695 [Planctomycetota bacterium]|jgi:hypothetical protein|nr:hypothetical protein [Planctomycetota bacterium]